MTREISRQAFVRGALGTAVGVLLGSCRPTPAPGRQTPPVVSGPQDWSALDDAIEGRVIVPSSAEYAAAKNLFNTRFANSTPAAVVAVKSADDVQKAVEFAASDIKIAVRSGGDSYIGASAAKAQWSSTYGSCPAGPATTPTTGS